MAILDVQPDATEGIDTYLNSGSPTATNGTATLLFLGFSTSTFRSILRFDLFALGLPHTAIINSATLRLNYAAAGSSAAAVIYRCTKIFDEAFASWNAYNAIANWDTAGGDIDGAINDTFTISSGTGFKDHDITTVARDAIENRSGVLNILFRLVTESVLFRFASSDNATPDNRPRLIIDYSLPGSPKNAYQLLILVDEEED